MEAWTQDLFRLLPEGDVFVTAIFVIALLEALVGVGLVMPGSVLTVFGGWLAFQGKGPIGAVMVAAGLGALLGDLISYALGARYGEHLWNGRWLKMWRKKRGMMRQAEVFFIEHGGKSVFFGRFLGPIRGLVPFIAGASRMRPGAFFAYAAISGLMWGISYPGLGWLGGTSWQRAETLAGRLGLLVGLGLAVTLLAYWLRHHFLPQRRAYRDRQDDQSSG